MTKLDSYQENILTAVSRHIGGKPQRVWTDEEKHPSTAPPVGCAYFTAKATGRPLGTVATFGMSSRRMTLDARAVESDTARAEIIAYVDDDIAGASLNRLVHWMRWAGQFPWLQDEPTFLGWGHTVNLSRQMGKLFPDVPTSKLTTLFTLSPIVRPDQGHVFEIDGDPVSFLWLTFLTDSEYALKKEKGENAILDLFQENKHPLDFAPDRKAYA